MKNNNLFRKFLALFLTGTMLAGVGCKDYDDDIDDINKKIDDLNAKVELKADASALQTISDKLKDVDFSKFVTDAELSQELAAYVKDADLKKKVGDLGFQTVTQVQDLIKGLQNEAQVKALIENQLKAADLWSKIGGEVKKGILEELAKNSELTTAVKNQAVAAVLAAITTDPAVKDIKTAISKIAGEEASEFVKEYMDVNNKAWIENVNSAAAEAVKNAESALSRQIISLSSTQGYLKKSDLTAELGAFKQAIAQHKADVAALIRRIQSLVTITGTMYVGSGGAYTTMYFYKAGATPIGIAYAIHSAVGNRMIGAKVNNRIVTLDHVLKNGDIVEILTSKNAKGPSRDWMKIAKSNEARSKIRQWFKKEKREENIVNGRAAFESELKHYGISVAAVTGDELRPTLLKKTGFGNLDDMYAAIGYGGFSAQKAVNRIRDELKALNKQQQAERDATVPIPGEPGKTRPAVPMREKSEDGIVVQGLSNCLVKFSKCCTPVPGDDIVGFITRGYGVSVHRADCPNAAPERRRPEEAGRWVKVSWGKDVKQSYQTSLDIYAKDRIDLVLDVSAVLSSTQTRVAGLNAKTTADGFALIHLEIFVADSEQLSAVMRRLHQISGVMKVDRPAG